MDFSIDCDGPLRTKVENALINAFSPVACETHGDRIEKCITDVLFGTKKIRFNNYDDSQRSFMENLVSRYVALGSPIKMIGMWGAIKGYGLNLRRCGIDIWDAMGLNRYFDVGNSVKNIYTPGIAVTIISEDITETVLGSQENLPPLIKAYADSLTDFANNHGDSVKILKESELLNQLGITTESFLQTASSMKDMLWAYWLASNTVDESQRTDLPEYKALNEVGWRGTIPNVMREHYLNRAATEYPNMDENARAQLVCTYFGIALSRYKVGMMKTNIDDTMGMLPPVKVGFGTLGPGVSGDMLKGRLDYKVKTSKNSKTTTPPWVGYGVLEDRSGVLEPTILGVRKVFDTEPVQVTSNGVCFQADILKIAA